MPITASCGNCGKSYQAPDHLAGKTVRCKQCGEMFRIDAGDADAADLDALERSFADEPLATGGATAMGGTAGGPGVDAHGRARIERGDGVDSLNVRGEAGSNLLRSNFRYRYAGAKQIDLFLPWVLVALCGFVLARACLNSGASGEEPPTQGVGLSRLAVLIAAYLFVIWPAAHVALMMATTRLRMSLPRAAPWRSFAAFTPVIMLAGGLYAFSGGDAVGLFMGLLVGATVAIGAVALLFRMFPNEVPTAAGYVAAGSVGGTLVAAGAVFLINLIGASLARLDKAPTLFTSPIAVNLPWVEAPAPPPKTTVARNTPAVAPPKPPIGTQPADVVPDAIALQSLPIPQAEGSDGPLLVKRLDLVTPVTPGFDQLLVPPVTSTALGVIRGGTVEVWDRSTWKQPAARRGRGVEGGRDAVAINTSGRAVWRLVSSPTDRLEQVALGNTRVQPPVGVRAADGARTLYGFVGESALLMRINAGDTLAFDRYDVAADAALGERRLFNSPGGKPMEIAATGATVRLLPDDSGVVVVGRDASSDAARPATIALYDGKAGTTPTSSHAIPWNDRLTLRPDGLAVTAGAKAALLLDSAGYAYLTVWEMRGVTTDGVTAPPRPKPLLDLKLDLKLDELRPGNWTGTNAMIWIDDETLLLYGNTVIDAESGVRLGTLGLDGVAEQIPSGTDALLVVQRRDGVNTLVQVTLDRATLAAKRTAARAQ